MSDTNTVVLTGNLTRDPELRFTPKGVAVANVGLASNRKYRQGDDLKEDVCFVDVTASVTLPRPWPNTSKRGAKSWSRAGSGFIAGRTKAARNAASSTSSPNA